jgi:SAM-dependent methyltransferase
LLDAGRALAAITLSAVLLSGCGTPAGNRRSPPATAGGIDMPRVEAAQSATVRKLVGEANALAPLAQSSLSRQFLSATGSLPAVAARSVFQDPQTREYFSPAEAAALPEARRGKLLKSELDEFRYYYSKYGSPLAYMRILDLAAQQGINDLGHKRVLDFGYGSIGHLRLLASLGASVTGIDTDSYLDALYRESGDQGAVPLAGRFLSLGGGDVTLVHGSYPKDPATAARVGQGYDLIISKNTLKHGYLKPERKVDKRLLVDLGVSDEVFLKALAAALKPGGKLIIYNLYPKAAAANEPYKPFADGRSPFSRKQFEQAGLRVVAFDQPDHEPARQIGRALKWDQNERGETVDDLDSNLFASYTLLEKRLP